MRQRRTGRKVNKKVRKARLGQVLHRSTVVQVKAGVLGGGVDSEGGSFFFTT